SRGAVGPPPALAFRYHSDINHHEAVAAHHRAPPRGPRFHARTHPMKENPIRSLPGIPVLLILLLLDVVAIALPLTHGVHPGPAWIAATVVTFLMAGVYKVEPNQAAVLSLFGKYVGTVKQDGLRWHNPFYAKRKISLRVRNFESGGRIVNELDGKKVDSKKVIVWRVVDSGEAVINVDEYESFVLILPEAALREMVTSDP